MGEEPKMSFWGRLNQKIFKHQFLLRLITVQPVLFLLASGTDMANAAQSPGLYWKICKIHTKVYTEIDCFHLETFEQHRTSTEAKIALHDANRGTPKYGNFTNFTLPTLEHWLNGSLSNNSSLAALVDLVKESKRHGNGTSRDRNETHWNTTVKSVSGKKQLTAALTIEDDVQSSAADWNMYIHLSSVLPQILVAPLYGAYSDRNGRKTNILLGITGVIATKLMYIAELTFVDMSLVMLPISQVFISLTGVQGNVHASCYSYISDRTLDKSQLTRRFMILQVVTDVAKIITAYSVGAILETAFCTKPMVAGIALMVLAFFYTLFFTVQKSPRETRESRKLQAAGAIPQNTASICVQFRNMISGISQSFAHNNSVGTKNDSIPKGDKVKETKQQVKWNPFIIVKKCVGLLQNCFSCFKRKREGHYRAYIYVTVAGFFFLYVAGEGMRTVRLLFEQRTPLAWDPAQLAYYKGFTEVVNLVGTVVTVLVLQRLHFHETTILLIGVTSNIIQLAFIGVSTNTEMMYAAGVFGMAGSLIQPVSKSLVCQFVDADEVGKVYVLFAFAVDFAKIISQTTISQLYHETLNIHRGFVFFFVAGLLCFTLAGFTWIHIDYKRYRAKAGLSETGPVPPNTAATNNNINNTVV